MNSSRAAEILGTLAPRAIEIGHVAGGVPVMTMSVVSSACANIDKIGGYFLRAKYCLDQSAEIRCAKELKEKICRSSDMTKYNPDSISRMATVIVRCAADPSITRCSKCKGRGQAAKGAVVMDCMRCGGTGRNSYTESAKARACGVDRQAWRNRGYDNLMRKWDDILHQLEQESLHKIALKLSEVA